MWYAVVCLLLLLGRLLGPVLFPGVRREALSHARTRRRTLSPALFTRIKSEVRPCLSRLFLLRRRGCRGRRGCGGQGHALRRGVLGEAADGYHPMSAAGFLHLEMSGTRTRLDVYSALSEEPDFARFASD